MRNLLVLFAIWMLRRLTGDAKLSHWDIYSNPRFEIGRRRGFDTKVIQKSGRI